MAGFDHLDLVHVVGQAVTLDGKPAKGKVTFTASTILKDVESGQAIFPVPLAVTLDRDGAFSQDLPATNDPDISPVGWTYKVHVDVAGSIAQDFVLAVPWDSGTIDLFAAAPVSGSGVVYVPQPAAGGSSLLSLMFGRQAWPLASL